MQGSTRQERLERRLCRLQEHRDEHSLQEHYGAAMPRISVLEGIELVHGTREWCLNGIVSACELRTPADLGKKPSEGQKAAKTAGCVCTSAGVPYPNRGVYLVFKRSAEAGRVVDATPFDSSRIWKSPALQSMSPEARDAFFEEHSLPAPEYRQYLVALVATCFCTVEDYLRNKSLAHSAPDGLFSDQKLPATFEVRFQDRLPLDTHLDAIVLPRLGNDITSRELIDRLDRLAEGGVTLYYSDVHESPSELVLSHLLNSIKEPGHALQR